MNESNLPSSSIAGPAILQLLGLPPETEKLTLTFEGGKDIKVESVSLLQNGENAVALHRILAEYKIVEIAREDVAL